MKIIYDFKFNKNKPIITLNIVNEKKNLIKFNFPKSHAGGINQDKNIKIIKTNINGKKSHNHFVKIVYTFYKFHKLNQKNIHKYAYHIIKYPDYFLFTSMNGLIIPYINKNTILDVTFITNSDNLFISGFGNLKKYEIKIDYETMHSLVFVNAKNYLEKNNVIITYPSNAYFFVNINYISNKLNQFIEKCNKFFNYNNNLKFLVNYIGNKTTEKTYLISGEGFYAGFNYFVFSNINRFIKDDKKTFMAILYHELYHHFNIFNGDEKIYWFSEGFTEFFSKLFSLSSKEFIYECNKFIESYYKNPYHNSNIKIMTHYNFWNNYYIEKLSYTKGFVYALYLYQSDKLFLDKYKKIINHNILYKKKQNNDYFKKMLKDKNFQKYIINGKTIKIKFNVEKIIKKYNLGFNLDKAIHDKILEITDNNSNIYKIGIKEGPISSIDIIENGDKIIIKQNKKKYIFSPLSDETLSIPKLIKI